MEEAPVKQGAYAKALEDVERRQVENMRVLQVLHEPLLEPTGISTHVLNLSKALLEEGVGVLVLAPKGRNSVPGIEVREVDYLRIPFFSAGKVPNPLSFARIFLSENFDVVHAHGYINAFTPLAFLFSLVKRRPFVLTLHGFPKAEGFGKKAILFLYSLLFDPLFRRFAKVLSVGKSEEVMKRFPNATFLPNPFPEWKPCEKKWRYKLCFISRLDKDKRPEWVLKIANALNVKRVLFAGREEDISREEIKKSAERLGIEAEFKLYPPEKMREVYCSCKYIVLPSKYEGFPMVLVEALSAGRPFLATPSNPTVVELANALGKFGELLIFREWREAVEKIKALDKSYAELTEKIKGLKIKREWSWKNIGRKVKKLYLTLSR